MDKNTLSNYGWIVICILVISVMLALATPFGEFVAGGFRSTYEGLTSTMNAALEKGLGIDLNGDGEVGGNTGDETTTLSAPRIELRDGTVYIYDVDENAQRLFIKLNGSDKKFYVGSGEEKTDDISGVDLEGKPILYLSMMPPSQGIMLGVTNEVSVFLEYVEGENIITSPNSDTIYFDGDTFEEVVAPSDCEHLNKEYISIDNDNHMVICNDCNQTVVDSEAHNLTNGICGGCNHEWLNLIPVGGTYKINGGETLVGDGLTVEFPETINDGDVYNYDDYKYTYQNVNSGWKVSYIGTSSEPVDMLSVINGQPVVNLTAVFSNNTTITKAPKISENAVYMNSLFQNCTALTDINNLVIPSSVIEITTMFKGCTSLTTAPDLSDCILLTDISNAFNGCTSLKTAPVIPSSVKVMLATFRNCTSLTGTITINAEPTNYNSCFGNIDFQAQHLTLTGTCDDATLDLIGATGSNYCAECNGYCYGHQETLAAPRLELVENETKVYFYDIPSDATDLIVVVTNSEGRTTTQTINLTEKTQDYINNLKLSYSVFIKDGGFFTEGINTIHCYVEDSTTSRTSANSNAVSITK